MNPLIDILTPTLWRHDRLAGLVANIHETTIAAHIITFVVEPDDAATLTTVDELMAVDPRVRLVLNERPNLAGAFATAVPTITATWWFLSDDDAIYTPGWDAECFRVLDDHPDACVIGTNDLHNPLVTAGTTATHILVRTDYIRDVGGTIDLGPGVVCCEEYNHNFLETEIVEAARQRGVWQPCMTAVVEHRHWSFGLAEYDATYEHGWKQGDVERADRAVWAVRRQLLEAPQC